MTIYDRNVTGNLEKQGETLRLWAQTYPRDPVAPGLLAGFFAVGTGQYELMIDEARNAIALGPDAGQAIPSFYSRPRSVEAVVDTVVWRILDQLGLPNPRAFRWKDEHSKTEQTQN